VFAARSPRAESAMTLMHAMLLAIIPATVVLALAVDLAAFVGFLRRRWR
jgi:hypothetical protein